MKTTLTLPQLGLTQTEGAVSEWLKKPGDFVRKDEIVFIVSTDKAEMEIESPSDGVMGEILVEPGLNVPVGTLLAYFEVAGESIGDPAPSPTETDLPAEIASDLSPHPPPPAAPTGTEPATREKIAASPRARRAAQELSIDLSTIRGSGPSGRVVEEDVRSAATLTTKASAQSPFSSGRRRQIIAQRMTESIQTIPAFSVTLEANAARLVDLYEDLGESFISETGIKLSYTDLLTKCIVLALTKTPELNASWHEDAPSSRRGIDLNLAVATDQGVAAPILRSLEQASLKEIARGRATLIEKARHGRLSLDDLEGGAGTLSNLGMYRVDSFEGIITPGQSFMLSVGRLARRPWAEADTLSIQPTIRLTLSVDHRIADGAQAAAFLGRIADCIDKPYALLWEKK